MFKGTFVRSAVFFFHYDICILGKEIVPFGYEESFFIRSPVFFVSEYLHQVIKTYLIQPYKIVWEK